MTLVFLPLMGILTSAISGVIGMGGGILLLATMAAVLDPMAVVPVHGVAQLVSNSSRAVRLLGHVNWRFVAAYVPMLFAGAALGVQFYRGAGAEWFRPAIGAFVLAFLVWQRIKPDRLVVPWPALLPAGFVGGVLTVVVGATGPYLAAFFLRDDMDRRQVVATKAAVQTIGHVVKIPAFLSLGFDYVAYAPLMGLLALAAIVGTMVGTSLLERVDETLFKRWFRIVLTVLALRLLVSPWL